MILLKHINDLQTRIKRLKHQGKRIGLVPTMGALHAGHHALIAESRHCNAVTVCSIFVNPTQFNDPEDYKKYPVSLEDDILQLEAHHTEILFYPSVEEMYPQGTARQQTYALGKLETILEGKYRPGHFQGVCQVVHKLLESVQPDEVCFGQKDYQQCMVVKKLIALTGMPITMRIVPTEREDDGLALSSRNRRLSPEGRRQATALYRALLHVKGGLAHKTVPELKQEAEQYLADAGFEKTDYIEVADAETLEPVTQWHEGDKLVVLAAAFLEGVRLIDNVITD